MVVSSVPASVRRNIVSMALIGNDVKFEIFLDRETLHAICTGRVPWYDPEDVHGYRCDGLDPEIFPGKEVPMKFWSPDHRVALEWYARAKRAGSISLPPTVLVMARMSARSFLEHCLRGDIVIHSKRSTCGLKKPLKNINYPDVVVDVIEFTENDAQRMLDYATEYLL